MKKLINAFLVIIGISAVFAISSNVSARETGADNAKYQGNTFVQGKSSDSFGISQIGGAYEWSLYPQATYHSQVATGTAQGLYMHSYIYLETGGNQAQTKYALDYYLPKIQTPKGSIVAIDYESGASGSKQANTDNLEYAFKRVKDAGYTPLLYSGTYYLRANVNYDSFFNNHPNTFWVASYATMNVTTTPNFAYFPTFRDVAIWQYTSMARPQGLDHNIELVNGITKAGYKGTTTSSQGGVAVKPNTNTSAINQGQKANNTPKNDIANNYTVKVNFSANNWSNGTAIPSWVKGHSYRVIQTDGNKVLLDSILSWIDKSNVEILQTSSQTASKPVAKATGTFNDDGYVVTRQDGYFIPNQTLRVWNYPGKGYTYINYYPGETIHYMGYIVRNGYVYVAYKASSGLIHYVAARQAWNGVPLGTFK